MNATTRTFVATLLLAGAAHAQIDVAIVAADSGCSVTDTQATLMASGLFSSVGVINVVSTTPTLAQLQAYDAVMCWTNSTPQDYVAWGNVMADYVDAGGGVVVTVFANSAVTAGRHLGGRWQTGYEVILDQSGNTSGNASLGAVAQPGHPVMQGVNTFTGGTAMYRPTGTALEVGAALVASWTDGKVLVAQGVNPRRIDLGFFPPSSNCVSSYWSTSSDGAKLLANALVAASGPCTGNVASYCTSSTTTNNCHPAMGSSGLLSAAASSGFTLTCSNVEGQKSGLFFYGINGPNAAVWAPGNTSTLCVKTPTQRMTTQNSGGNLGACDGTLSQDFRAFLAANPGAVGTPAAAGQQFHAQTWFRDPAAIKTTNLSNGLSFVMCP